MKNQNVIEWRKAIKPRMKAQDLSKYKSPLLVIKGNMQTVYSISAPLMRISKKMIMNNSGRFFKYGKLFHFLQKCTFATFYSYLKISLISLLED